MAPVTNGRIILKTLPTGYPEVGKHIVFDSSETIDIETVALNGGVLLKTLILSPDPFLRTQMVSPDTKGLIMPAFPVGQPLPGLAIAVVLRSEVDSLKVGDVVQGLVPWMNYIIMPSAEGLNVMPNYLNLPWSVFVNSLGLAGQTAYIGWKEHSKPNKGDVVYVTAAAGPVGSFVVQMAKRDGLKVIAEAGSDDKVEFVKSIGADVAFNYKTEDRTAVLERESPINIFWDNVGGAALDAALLNAARNSRFIECGMATGYNTGYIPIKNLMDLIHKDIKMFGFNAISYFEKYLPEFYTTVPKLVADGEIKYREQIFNGIESAPEALIATFNGTAKGKAVVVVSEI